jgi:hypothetical protein
LISDNNTVYKLVGSATLEGGFQREEFPGEGKTSETDDVAAQRETLVCSP